MNEILINLKWEINWHMWCQKYELRVTAKYRICLPPTV